MSRWCFLVPAIATAIVAAGASRPHADAPGTQSPDPVRSAIDRTMDGPIKEGKVAGASISVMRRGETIISKSYGSADLELDVPMPSDASFEIGSVTKQFTAAAILRLAEQGKLSLDDPVTRLRPDLPAPYRAVTLAHLLTHTSGVPSYTDLPEWRAHWREDMSLDTLIALFRDRPLEFVPGQSWKYSNSGYVVLGAVIEKASGKTYEDYVEQELFAPLGMTRSRYGHQEEVVEGRAAGYLKTPQGWTNAPYLSLSQPYAAGSLMSTVDDLARWSDALESGQVVSPASRDRMFTPAVLDGGAHAGVSTRYGLGNGVTDTGGHVTHEHGGGIFGYVCDLMRVPDADLLVVLLSNNPTVDPHRMAHRIAEQALGVAKPTAPALTLDAAKLEAYVGTYEDERGLDGRHVVTRKDDGLRLGSRGGLADLHALGDDRFESADQSTAVRFLRDGAGKVVAIEVDQGIGPVFPQPRAGQ